MNRLELVQQIKFALTRLGDGNSHHEFEKICLAFARQRISINFLPATGPVAGRGDQGRDGETFWSHLSLEGGGGTSTGNIRVGDESVSLACTLQASGLTSKVVADLTSITTSGTHVDRVAYFTNGPVPVGLRHELIALARERFDIGLDVFDVEALAVNLADPDLFWVASEYLRIASDAAPAIPQTGGLPEWYLEIRERWRNADHLPSTSGDLAELRLIVRGATWNENARPDLPFALELLNELVESESFEIRWKASYETCVATYRGTGDFHAIEQRLLGLVELALADRLDPTYLQDAHVLVTYGCGAALRGLTTTTMSGWRELSSRLADHVSVELGIAGSANRRASLLSIQSSLAFAVAYPDDVAGRLEGLETEDELSYEGLAEIEYIEEVLPLVDRDGGMVALSNLLEVLPEAPMFPVGSISGTFDLLTMSLVDHPAYAAVRSGVDAALARATGESSTAERAFHRAFTLADSGRYRSSLADAMTASRSSWRAHDLLVSVQSMILEGDLLQVMGLHVASKSRYLAAAWVAGSHVDDQIRAVAAEGLLGAAMQDYYLGRWLTALPEFVEGFNHHAQFQVVPNADSRRYVQPAYQAFTNILAMARSSPPLKAWIEERLGDSEAGSVWDGVPAPTSDELQDLLEGVIGAHLPPPFSDIQEIWSVRWKSYGVRWGFEFLRDAPTVRAAERVMSMVQQMLVALAETNLEWVPTTLHVSVRAGAAAPELAIVEEAPAGRGAGIWVTVTLGPDESDGQSDPAGRMASLGEEARSVAMQLLAMAFVNGEDALATIGERVLGPEGAFSSPVVRLYDDMARIFEPWPGLPLAALREGLSTGLEIPYTNSALAAHEESSPLLNEEATREHIRARYTATLTSLWRSLPRIVADADCMEVLSTLHEEGALDWQILCAINNLVGTHRVESAGIDVEDERMRNGAEALMRSPEGVDESEVPLELFTEASLRRSMQLVAFSCLRSYGLELHSSAPDLEAIQALLTSRFEYLEIDEPHADIFGWLPASGDDDTAEE